VRNTKLLIQVTIEVVMDEAGLGEFYWFCSYMYGNTTCSFLWCFFNDE